MTDTEEPLIYCENCKGPGATAFRGWRLLCSDCANAELSEFFDTRAN